MVKKPTILHIQSRQELKTPDVIYIGAQDATKSYPESKWMCPQIPFEDIRKYQHWTIWRAKMFEHYEKYIRSRPEIMSSITELEGKKLACWCDMYPCYGEILIKIFCEKTGCQFIPEPVTILSEHYRK